MKKQSVLNVGLSGASGRMGGAVKSLIRKKNSGFVLCAKAGGLRKKQSSGFNSWQARQISGVIDFSAPPLFEQALFWCLKHKKPFVSGTTALSPAQKRKLKQAGQKIPVFYEENMSWGIGQITKWIQNMRLPEGELLLQDIHHKNKKDRPSGTALKLKKHFPQALKRKLRIQSKRVGEVFGIHRILIKNPEEEVLLEHKALSRKLFAGGALKALKWLVKQPAGLYSFKDLYKE